MWRSAGLLAQPPSSGPVQGPKQLVVVHVPGGRPAPLTLHFSDCLWPLPLSVAPPLIHAETCASVSRIPSPSPGASCPFRLQPPLSTDVPV